MVGAQLDQPKILQANDIDIGRVSWTEHLGSDIYFMGLRDISSGIVSGCKLLVNEKKFAQISTLPFLCPTYTDLA